MLNSDAESDARTGCRLEVGDTADWKSAPQTLREEQRGWVVTKSGARYLVCESDARVHDVHFIRCSLKKRMVARNKSLFFFREAVTLVLRHEIPDGLAVVANGFDHLLGFGDGHAGRSCPQRTRGS